MERVVRVVLVAALMVGVLWSSTGLSLFMECTHLASSARYEGGEGDEGNEEWYPCKDHGCGCISAQMCRTNCCCEKDEPEQVVVEKAAEEDSCCAADEAQVTDSGGDEAVRIVLQSPRCSGRDPSRMLVVPVWLHEPIADVIALSPTVFVCVAVHRDPGSLSMEPEPPPPRG
jgi:hypothetical protein